MGGKNFGLDLNSIHSLSEFQRNTKGLIRKLMNGQAEVVIQSAEAYQKLLDDQQLLETIRGISRGLEQANRGAGRPMRALLEELAGKHGIALKSRGGMRSSSRRRMPE